MKAYLLIDHSDYYETKIVAAFTSEPKAEAYGRKYAKKEHVVDCNWWIEDYELDPEFKEAEDVHGSISGQR